VFLLPGLPAHALGGGSTDVAPTAESNYCAGGPCTLHVREFDVTNRGHIELADWRADIGVWSTGAETVPFTLAGGVSASGFGLRWATDTSGQLQCWNGSWQSNPAGGGWDVDAKRATPGTDNVNGQFYYATAVKPTPGQTYFTPWLITPFSTPCFNGSLL